MSKSSVATIVRTAMAGAAVAILMSGVPRSAQAARPDPAVDPATGQAYGPSHPRYGFRFKPGDLAGPRKFAIPLDQSECDNARRANPSWVQQGSCTMTLTLVEKPTETNGEGNAAPTAIGSGVRSAVRVRIGTFLGQRRFLSGGLSSIHPMYTCNPACTGHYDYDSALSGPAVSWWAHDHFAWHYNFVHWYGDYNDVSRYGGLWGYGVIMGWNGYYNDGDPLNLGWMEGGENITVTSPSINGIGQASIGHGQRVRGLSDGEVYAYGW